MTTAPAATITAITIVAVRHGSASPGVEGAGSGGRRSTLARPTITGATLNILGMHAPDDFGDPFGGGRRQSRKDGERADPPREACGNRGRLVIERDAERATPPDENLRAGRGPDGLGDVAVPGELRLERCDLRVADELTVGRDGSDTLDQGVEHLRVRVVHRQRNRFRTDDRARRASVQCAHPMPVLL